MPKQCQATYRRPLKTPETTPPLIPTNFATAPRLQLRNRLNLKEGKLHPHYPRVVRGRDTQLQSHMNTREAFSNLTTGQMLGYGSAGVLAGASIYAYGIADDAIVPLLLCLIAILLSWIGPQIIHELMELNDQLAGRPLECHERHFLSPFSEKGMPSSIAHLGLDGIKSFVEKLGNPPNFTSRGIELRDSLFSGPSRSITSETTPPSIPTNFAMALHPMAEPDILRVEDAKAGVRLLRRRKLHVARRRLRRTFVANFPLEWSRTVATPRR
jgi:hypothetical protein